MVEPEITRNIATSRGHTRIHLGVKCPPPPGSRYYRQVHLLAGSLVFCQEYITSVINYTQAKLSHGASTHAHKHFASSVAEMQNLVCYFGLYPTMAALILAASQLLNQGILDPHIGVSFWDIQYNKKTS